MLLRSPTGKYVELDETKALIWIKQGFEIVEDQIEIDNYRQERVGRLSKLTGNKEGNFDGIYFSSPPEGANGYGQSRKFIKRSLERLGLEVSENYTNQRVGLLYHSPYAVTSLQTDIKILYTMFESDKIPDNWKHYLDMVDLIVVPSLWCAQVFAKAGYTASVVPLAYNTDEFVYKERRSTRKVYTFLHYDAFNIRKGFREVFNAFTKEFTTDDDVKLILKTTRRSNPFPIVKSQYPNIEVIRDSYTHKQLAELCQKSDCFVFPSRGEGFGLTPLEAMGTGACAIVPNAHGISQYFDSNFMYEVNVESKTPALYNKYEGEDVGSMVLCDEKHLRKQMRYVYENQKESREMGKKASEYVKKYNYEQTARGLMNLINMVSNNESKSNKDFLAVERI